MGPIVIFSVHFLASVSQDYSAGDVTLNTKYVVRRPLDENGIVRAENFTRSRRCRRPSFLRFFADNVDEILPTLIPFRPT